MDTDLYWWYLAGCVSGVLARGWVDRERSIADEQFTRVLLAYMESKVDSQKVGMHDIIM